MPFMTEAESLKAKPTPSSADIGTTLEAMRPPTTKTLHRAGANLVQQVDLTAELVVRKQAQLHAAVAVLGDVVGGFLEADVRGVCGRQRMRDLPRELGSACARDEGAAENGSGCDGTEHGAASGVGDGRLLLYGWSKSATAPLVSRPGFCASSASAKRCSTSTARPLWPASPGRATACVFHSAAPSARRRSGWRPPRRPCRRSAPPSSSSPAGTRRP